MNDFLKNLRSQQKEKFGTSYRSGNEKQSYPHPDRRSGGDRRSQTSFSKSSANVDMLAKRLTELIPEVRALMANYADTNDRLMDLMDRFVTVEAERNSFFESIAESMSIIADKGLISPESGSGSNGEYKKTKKIPKEERDKIMDIVFSMREKGSTYEQIAEYLETEKVPTFSNKGHWHAQTIHRLYQQRKSELGY